MNRLITSLLIQMRGWLPGIACLAICLPQQLLVSCCCSRSISLSSVIEKLYLADSQDCSTSGETKSCCGTKAESSCCEGGCSSGSCSPSVTQSTDSSEGCAASTSPLCDALCNTDCGCHCVAVTQSNIAVAGQTIVTSVSHAAILVAWDIPPVACQLRSLASDIDKPPISHNRRQSLLCVWNN